MRHDDRAGELIFVHGRDPYFSVGGGESYVRAHAQMAASLGLRPHVFAIGSTTRTYETADATVHIVGSPFRVAPHVSLAVHEPMLRRAVFEFLRTRPGRHLIHGFAFWCGLSAREKARLSQVGVHVTLLTSVWCTTNHESPAKLRSAVVQGNFRRKLALSAEVRWNSLVTQRVENRIARQSEILLVNYASVSDMLAADCEPGLPIRKIGYVAPASFDEETWLEDPVGDLPTAEVDIVSRLRSCEIPVIVALSRHDGRKGLDVLIEALALLRGRGVDFLAVIAGTGDLYAEHCTLVQDRGLTAHVLLPGRVAEVMPYLLASDVFVLPSHEESSGSVSVLEALQAGTAIVSTNVDGLPEDLTDGVDALLVPPGHPEAIADAIARLIAEDSLRSSLSSAGRALYERRFSPRTVTVELASVYRDLGLLDPAL